MSVELRDVYLHGSLRQFGKHFRLAVTTPAEAVRALCIQIKGLRAAIRDGFYRVIVGAPGRRRDRSEDELNAGFDRSVHVVPVIAGAGGGKGLATGLLIAGAALLAVAFAPAALGLGALGSTTIFGISSTTVGLFGAALALQGVSMLLAPKPKMEGGKTQGNERLESFMFGGLPYRPVAGRPVPVTFGSFRVDCEPISLAIRNVKLGSQSASYSTERNRGG